MHAFNINKMDENHLKRERWKRRMKRERWKKEGII
jgi:hypothetical protein